MPKILKPYTIIPSNLYVHRDADRQIKNIIKDMGRPGYVLVSRQMGKTNLLLNAKRELESLEDTFTYVDLSNPFESAKSCFENIIDLAIETNYDKFNEVGKQIIERRKDLVDTPPHKQHTNELRLLLKTIPGKLVIILDEIDALTKTQYSDQIFAQIRSVYFSRVNFPELENLTYILSGVVEPTEIIKDPKISPFNIGQKIFLNDFSKNEFDQFLEKANLSVSEEIKERIYYWTSGSPRITWDICSEIENHQTNETITTDLIDRIVQTLYLTSFDKPPIDNIRELVKTDREIRNAIIEIEYHKSKTISDNVKSKLYLAGIANYEESDINVKNNIIRKSLNIEWIRSIEEKEKGLVKIAIENFEKEDFKESLSIFEKYLEDNNFDEIDESVCYYYMGYAAYRCSEFKKALSYLDKAHFDIDDESKLYYRAINLKGLANYYEENINESLEYFKEVISSGKRDETYARALLNFGSIALKSDNDSYKLEAFKIFNDIVDIKFDSSKLKEPLIKELKSIAHFNIAQIVKERGEINKAKEHYVYAIELSKEKTKPIMLLNLISITTEKNEVESLVGDLVNLIVEKKLLPIEPDQEKPIDFSYDEFRDIAIKCFLNYHETLFQNIKSSLNILGNKSLALHILELAVYSINNQDWDKGKEILLKLYNNKNIDEYELDDSTNYHLLRLLAYLTDINQNNSFHHQYFELFNNQKNPDINFIDFDNFSSIIFYLSSVNKYDQALTYISNINSVKDKVSQEFLINYSVINHLELNIYAFRSLAKEALRKASELLEFLSSDFIKKSKSSLLGETGLDTIRQNAENIRLRFSMSIPTVNQNKISRNDLIKVRYKDGTVLNVKYKKVELDIKNGECFILN